MEKQCCLCGGGGKEIGEGIYACDDCIIGAVYEVYEKRYIKRSWYRTKVNWGTWVLIAGFIAFLVTWFIVKPMLERGG